MYSAAGSPSIANVFRELRAAGRMGLVPYVPAGYPNLQTTEQCLSALESAGAAVIEVGFPFSDPIADGPVIQESFTAALAHQTKVADVFETISRVAPRLSVPLAPMVSFSIVFRYGVQRFCTDAKQAGVAGLIVPDLPPPEAQSVCQIARAAGLDTILLVAPTTTCERRAQIAALSSGFIYYLSVAGITGEREQLPPDLAKNIGELRKITTTPVCVGFGIYRPSHVAQLSGIADGAIVGTAYVRRIKEHLHDSPQQISRIVADFTRELLSGCG